MVQEIGNLKEREGLRVQLLRTIYMSLGFPGQWSLRVTYSCNINCNLRSFEYIISLDWSYDVLFYIFCKNFVAFITFIVSIYTILSFGYLRPIFYINLDTFEFPYLTICIDLSAHFGHHYNNLHPNSPFILVFFGFSIPSQIYTTADVAQSWYSVQNVWCSRWNL